VRFDGGRPTTAPAFSWQRVGSRGRTDRRAYPRAERAAAAPPTADALTGYTPGVMEGSASPDPAAAGPTGTGSAPAPAGAASRSITRARRPAIVTILAILQLLNAAAYGVLLAVLLATGPDSLVALLGDGLLGEVEAVAVAVLLGGIVVATLAAGILLLRMRQLGWTITMLLSGLGLVSSIAVWWAQATTTPILLFVQVASVFYLNQRQVREAFGISRREAGDALSDTRDTRDSPGATPIESRE